MAKGTVQVDQDKLLDRLERLEKQIAKSGEQRGGGFGTALKAFAVGALAGGGLALLYAPQRGEQTRQRLLQAKEQATQVAGQAREQTAQLAGQVKEQATQVAGQAQQAVSQLKDQVQSSATTSPPAPTPLAVTQQRQERASGKESPA
jgi:gas vesicle protein